MLYQIYETQRSLMEPFADFAQAAAKVYSNPISPLGQNPFSQRISATYDLMYRLGKDYEKPQFGINTWPLVIKKLPSTNALKSTSLFASCAVSSASAMTLPP